MGLSQTLGAVYRVVTRRGRRNFYPHDINEDVCVILTMLLRMKEGWMLKMLLQGKMRIEVDEDRREIGFEDVAQFSEFALFI